MLTHLYLRIRHGQAGQSTAEYSLVLLGVAGLALLVGAWAADTDKIGELLDTVFDTVTDMVGAG